jgi:hypothetical protein
MPREISISWKVKVILFARSLKGQHVLLTNGVSVLEIKENPQVEYKRPNFMQQSEFENTFGCCHPRIVNHQFGLGQQFRKMGALLTNPCQLLLPPKNRTS